MKSVQFIITSIITTLPLVRFLACIVAVSSITACGPSIPTRILLTDIEVAKVEKLSNNKDFPPSVFIDEFQDTRDQSAVVFFPSDNESTEPMQNDLGQLVGSTLKSILTNKGFNIDDSAPVTLQGQIRTWKATVSGGMSAKIDGEAVISIAVMDPANKALYSGVYRGFANMEATAVGAGDYQEVLSAAMSEAIRNLSEDAKLMGLLTSF